MKKRALAMVFAAFIAMSLTACGESSTTSGSTNGEDSQVVSAEETEEIGGSSTSNEEDISENIEDPQASTDSEESSLSLYDVTITGAKTSENYSGDPLIYIEYTWTNNTDDTISALSVLHSDAYQDGVELEQAVVSVKYPYSTTKIRPGITHEVGAFYHLTSDSDVEFEVYASADWHLDDQPKETAVFKLDDLDEFEEED